PARGGAAFGGVSFVVVTGGPGHPARGEARVRVWDLGLNLRRTWTFPHHIRSAHFSPDGRTLAVVGVSGVRLFDVASEKPVSGFNLEPGSISYCFHPDAPILVTGTERGEVAHWHIPTGKLIGRPVRVAEGLPYLSARPDGAVYLAGTGRRRAVTWPHLPPGPARRARCGRGSRG
ncbi:MAG: WD40 repeat domain-containing protein, partial [Gemmataceae bacterium]